MHNSKITLRDGPLFFWRGRGGSGGWEIIFCKHFFPSSSSFKNFFSIFSSGFFLFVLNITVALLNYFSKDLINSAIVTYFVDVRSLTFFNFWQLLTQIKVIRWEIVKGSSGFFAIPQYRSPDPLWWCSHRPSYSYHPACCTRGEGN